MATLEEAISILEPKPSIRYDPPTIHQGSSWFIRPVSAMDVEWVGPLILIQIIIYCPSSGLTHLIGVWSLIYVGWFSMCLLSFFVLDEHFRLRNDILCRFKSLIITGHAFFFLFPQVPSGKLTLGPWLVGGLEHLDYFSIQLGISSSQLTFTLSFFGVGWNHNQIINNHH
jgi:hypothetical protein